MRRGRKILTYLCFSLAAASVVIESLAIYSASREGFDPSILPAILVSIALVAIAVGLLAVAAAQMIGR